VKRAGLKSGARLAWLALLIVAAVLLSGCSFSLAQDILPPENFQSPQTQVTPDKAVSLPMVPPDPSQGAAIYAEKCAACHGPAGLGDGAQAGELPVPVPALSNPDLVQLARPDLWFDMVSNGNLERFMPPFSGSLTERQIWDVVAYAFTLRASQDDLAAGEQVYRETCQSCHGPAGGGDGERAQDNGVNVPSWQDPRRLIDFSDHRMEVVIANGEGEMPGYTGVLNVEERRQVTWFVRSLSFAQDGDLIGQPPEVEPTLAGSFRIHGQVTNGSGAPLADGMTVQLLGFDNMQQALMKEAPVEEDGSYQFTNIELESGRGFVLMMQYQNTMFYSDILESAQIRPGDMVSLPLQIYESTTNLANLVAERGHIFFDFSEPGSVSIVELFIISNRSDRVVAGESEGMPVIRFDLPEGATDLQFENGELGGRFVEIPGGFGDTQSVLPGNAQHQVLFGYRLPYNGKANIQLSMPLPVRAVVVAAPGGNGVHLQSEQLLDSGERQVQGTSMHMYGASDMPAGSQLSINLSGRARSSGSTLTGGTTTGLVLGGLAFGVALIFTGLWWRGTQQQRKAPVGEPEQQDDVEGLLDAIVALDDMHRAGNLPDDAYQMRRGELKERLRRARSMQADQR